jgi:hypothetical protein
MAREIQLKVWIILGKWKIYCSLLGPRINSRGTRCPALGPIDSSRVPSGFLPDED